MDAGKESYGRRVPHSRARVRAAEVPTLRQSKDISSKEVLMRLRALNAS